MFKASLLSSRDLGNKSGMESQKVDVLYSAGTLVH
jgi:hypothetical protein